MTQKQQDDAQEQDIEPGMQVETTGGDLGEKDIDQPRVSKVIRDQNGNIKDVVVSKGVVFRKKLDVPADRITSVEPAPSGNPAQGEVTIDTTRGEIAALKSTGEEALADEEEGLLDTLEQEIPTAEGVRELEFSGNAAQARRSEIEKQEDAAEVAEGADEGVGARQRTHSLLRVLGPGFLAGMAGNDASAVTSYSVDGATAGYGHLWLMLLSTPLYQAVQYACAKIGRVTQKGMAEILRQHYSPWIAAFASLVLIVANIALVAADLVAIGSGLQLITDINWLWFIIPIAFLLWFLTVYESFETIKKIFIVMSLVFVTYIITAIFAKANWGAVLFNTFVPHVSFGFASISSAVALLGATISPYNIFWQVQGEKEEARAGSTKQQMHGAALDIAIGVVSGNLIAYFIIVSTAATLFTHHKSIATAADAALALQPLLGPFGKYLFAIGLIGAGFIAIPVLLASTSYAVSGTFGWPGGLSKKPWQSEGFYLILTAALVVSMVIALLHLDPIQLIFWANVLNGVLAPVLVIYLLIVGNNGKIMGKRRLGHFTNIGLAVTVLVMVAAAALLFYGLATGQGS
jgi:NRAMP (natural resistance-associated macrophage protein)-like metal ion transporter